jgi:hypothetical protein
MLLLWSYTMRKTLGTRRNTIMETGSNRRVAHQKGVVGGGVAASRRCSSGWRSVSVDPRAPPVHRGSLGPAHKERQRVRRAVSSDRRRGKLVTCNGGSLGRKKASVRAGQEVKASLLIGARPGGADTADRVEQRVGAGRHRRERQWCAETHEQGGTSWRGWVACVGGSVLVGRAWLSERGRRTAPR